MNKVMAPTYTHDCTECQFLATTFGSQLLDWYVHGSPFAATENCSIIARASSVGSDYSSWPASLIHSSLNSHDSTGRIGLSESGVLAQFMLNLAMENDLG